METILEIKDLHKKYSKTKAVSGLSLEVKKGTVHGILGPNGSGKTTTLGVVLNVIKKTSGTYSWFGGMPEKESRKKLGVILETPSFYPYLSAIENLKIAAAIKNKGEDRIGDVLKQVNLYDRGHDAFRTFSLGMKQRLAIAAALVSDPPVLILDEPTNGLDPQGIAEVRTLITDLARQGKTILLASHMLDEVQKVCTHFTVLKKGKKIYEGSVKEALENDQCIEIASEDMDGLTKVVKEFNLLTEIVENNDKLTIKMNNEGNTTILNKFLFDRGIVLSHLNKKTGSLEQHFLNILKESND